MRIIAGQLGGRHFDSPSGHRTHPMSDKMRGALFNALGDISGLTILDAFAGSGALAFEAISRGAARAMLIDNDTNAQRAITTNIKELNITAQAKLIQATAQAWLSTASGQFDIVLCDPPYDKLQTELLQRLSERVRPGGLMVLSLPPATGFTLPKEYKPLADKDYGDSTLRFYRRTGN